MLRLRSFVSPSMADSFLLQRFLFSSSPTQLSNDEESAVFRIVNSSPTRESMAKSLQDSGILLSNDLIDRVLKRARFSHSNPSRTLDFFSIAAQQKGFFHTPISVDTMLYILGRSRRFEEIWQILRETKRKDRSLLSPRTVQIVLGRIAKVCSVKQTVQSFWKFKKLVENFDVSCFNALLRVLTQEKTMVDARNVYHSLKRDFRPDLYTFNILLSGWRSSEEAEAFFEEMKELGVKPDLVSYNCLVDVFCKNREMEKAFETLEKMREEEIYPDKLTYTSIIGGLGLIGQPDKAKNMLKEMKEHGSYPDVAAYNAAIRNFCIAKRLQDAFALLDEMELKGLSPNPTSYNIFFRVFYWSNDLTSAWRLYQRMRNRGCWPNTQSCMFVIRLCKRQEKAGMAIELWNDMIEKGFGSYILVSDVLFDLLCDLGLLADAERCFLQMVGKGQKPSFASFKRIKVLMKLANQHEQIENLSKKMSCFGVSLEFEEQGKNGNSEGDHFLALGSAGLQRY
ncbi:pentatricopeptide repeat (PPR) superfamily protein [Wolffia australiana]